eukprot:12032453-Alexandrium_andersonii.AAC.1
MNLNKRALNCPVRAACPNCCRHAALCTTMAWPISWGVCATSPGSIALGHRTCNSRGAWPTTAP